MKIWVDTEGSTLIELTFIAPILILMLLGTLDIGVVLRSYIALMDSTRAGAEYSLVSGHEADTSGWRATATYSAGPIAGYAVTAKSFCTCGAGGSTVSCSGSCASTTISQYAEVAATASIPLAFYVRGLPANIPLQAVSRIRTKFTSGQ